MPALHKDLRNQLSKAILDARKAAEAGAQKALESLAVHHHEPHASMTPAERDLRRRLRARGRQLGDVRDAKTGKQTITRLTHEVAYEQWHRMLFARFLAENHLLIHPELGVAVSLDEIKEIAQETGEDPRELAARYAQDALPQIFRRGDPVLEVDLAPEVRQKLNQLVTALPEPVFTADDSLGWTYQFWQAEKKDEVNKSGVKIGADELPAVTQLFTEHYMVLFLLHNTVGAWWAGQKLAENPDLAKTAKDENDLRAALRLDALGGYDFEYLRFVREKQEADEDDKPTGPWKPAAGTFDGWPKTVAELTVLDPCCGSGHFLVAVLDLLVRLHMEATGLNVNDAVQTVLKDNLFGLELDPRCTQIAAFNVALAAWKLASGPVKLPQLNIACSGLAPNCSEDEWVKIAETKLAVGGGLPSLGREPLKNGLRNLHRQFSLAPYIGSLIDPAKLPSDLISVDFETLAPFLADVMDAEQSSGGGDAEAMEHAVAARGMAAAAEILAGPDMGYTLVVTNVPYLGRGNQHARLKEYIDQHHKLAKADLATAFLDRALDWLSTGQSGEKTSSGGGTVAAVTPQNWLFLTSYKKLREKLLKERSWNIHARLGPKGFQTPMWDFNTMLFVMSAGKPANDHRMSGLDVMYKPNAKEKANSLRETQDLRQLKQQRQLKNPNAAIVFEDIDTNLPRLESLVSCLAGAKAGDLSRFALTYWEIPSSFIGDDWEFYQLAPHITEPFKGRSWVIFWQKECGEMSRLAASVRNLNHVAQNWLRGKPNWGKPGVVVGLMADIPATLFSGHIYDSNCCAIVPKQPEHTAALWCFCESGEYTKSLRKLNQALAVGSPQALIAVPFDLAHWQHVAAEKYPHGLPEPESDDPTQWLFHGRSDEAQAGTELQVVVGRLLGYRWPAELDKDMRLSDRARGLASSCDELLHHADDDGIVCLAATKSEQPAAQRVRKLLADAYGKEWSPEKEKELLASAEAGNATLEEWLRDKFFEQHCKLFHHRPFVWHLWDGNPTGFHCLVNAHKLCGPGEQGRKTLELITYTYLGDWINRQQADQQDEVEGADARLVAAQDLQDQLKKILAGEPPYDLFVRWKPLHEQAIGWEPDINDGVRMNIRPFMKATLRKGGKKGAGLLRWKPNIKWKKDRGKEPQRPKDAFPWFWSCEDGETDFAGGKKFDGNRWNDLHYTKAVKEAARKQAEKAKA